MVVDDFRYFSYLCEMTDQERITELEDRVVKLEDKLIDLMFELNYNKQDELIEFIRELYQSLQNVDEKLSKESIIENLKNYIRDFAKNNNLML